MASIVNGYPFDSKLFDVNGPHSLIRIRDLNSRETETKYVGKWVDAASVESGDVLIGMDGDFNVGVWRGGRALLNQRMCCVRGESPLVSRFLAYVLPAPLKVMNDLTYFTTVKHLSSFDVERITVVTPPSDLLESVVQFLDDKVARIDALIAEKERLLLALEEFRLSTISKCVSFGMTDAPRQGTGDDWFPEVPSGWSFCALNYRYEVQLGKMLDEKRNTGKSPMPYLRNIDVRWDHVNTDVLPVMDISPGERERYTVQRGDLLVCEGGVGVGRAAIWNGPSHTIAFQKALHRLRPRYASDLPRFLLYLMEDSVWRGRVGGQEKATIPHLPAEAFRRWRFPFPPGPEQAALVRYLDDISVRTRGLATHCLEHISRLFEYRSSLISAAVTGQLDPGAYETTSVPDLASELVES